MGYNSLTTLTKILKISSHLGHWRTYSFGTEDFPALSEADRALADENEYVEYVHGPHGGGHQHNYNQENEGCLKDLKDMLGGLVTLIMRFLTQQYQVLLEFTFRR